MTIKELYEWACENGVEDYYIQARTCDGNYVDVSINNGDIDMDDEYKEVFLL